MSSARYLADIHAQPETLAILTTAYSVGEERQSLQRAAVLLRSSAVMTGMGASYFALLAARPSFDRAAIPVRIEDAGYLLDYGLRTVMPGQPVVLVSQSGQSIELRLLVDRLPADCPLVLITNDPNADLATRADIVLPLLSRPDESVALKTYTATIALLLMLAAEAGRGSTETIASALVDGRPMERAIEQADRFLRSSLPLPTSYVVLLGQGPSIASALGGALLIKETAKLPAEGFNGGQFRHGAIEVVSRDMVTIVFAPAGQGRRLNRQLEVELDRAGALVIIIGVGESANGSIRQSIVGIESPDEYLAPVFEIVAIQLLSHALAVHRGVEPGAFVNTVPVIASLGDLPR